MADSSLNRPLRAAATQGQVAEILKKALETTNTASLTAHLLSAVETGTIPPVVFRVYLPLSRDPHALEAALRQRHSASIRHGAIIQLGKALRAGSGVRATWTALGDAAGIAALMRELSVKDVGLLCRALGQPGPRRDTSGAAEREEAISELFGLLAYKPTKRVGENGDSSSPDRDERPLGNAYKRLLSACTTKTRDQWRQNENPSHNSEVKVTVFCPNYVKPGQDDKLIAPVQPRSASVRLDGVGWLLSEGRLKKLQADIVEKIDACDANDLKINAAKFTAELLLPLAKGVAKGRTLVSGVCDKAWDLILASLHRWPDLAHELNFKQNGLLSRAISWWNYAPTEERHARAGIVLRSLLKLVPAALFPSLDGFPDILRVKKAYRFELLVWLLSSPNKYGIDVESPSVEDMEKLKGIDISLPCQIFRLLPIDKSINLLNLLADIRPDKTFLEPRTGCFSGRTILSQTSDPIGATRRGDYPLLHCLLLTHLSPGDLRRANSEIRNNIKDILKQRMTKANQSREPGDRLAWAKSALFLAIASGSVELYANTLSWARRFDKDQFVVSHLYQDDVLGTKEGLGLLAAIPSMDRLSVVPVVTVRADIVEANNIVLHLLQTAAVALQEPSYQARSWVPVGKLASTIVRARFELVNAWQTYHHLSDDETFSLIWQPTLSMLIEAEKLVLRPELSRMGLAKLEGLLDSLILAEIPELRGHAWKFLDNLAKARDETWRQERVKRCPAVLTLEAPWPKGLPVQALFHIPSDLGKQAVKLPYVLSRAEAVVFGDAKTLCSPMPGDDETRAAISGFCENYGACLQVYFHSGDGDDDTARQARIARAWNHATHELTRNWEHSRAFWLRWAFGAYEKWVPGPSESAQRSRPGPVFPEPTDPKVPMEWHPDPKIQARETVELELPGVLSRLECMLGMLGMPESRAATGVFDNRLSAFKKTVYIAGVPGFWSEGRYDSPLSGSTQDVYIAAAMLYINSEAGCGKSLLMEPFPSAENPRFPALYLADEFLESSKPGSLFDCFRLLEAFQKRIPPELLLRLARYMLEGQRMADVPNGARVRLTIDIIVLLSRGERPSLACDLIRDVVIDRQGDSSWHRHLFNAGFLALLPAAEAKAFLNDITDAMIDRLAQAKHYTKSMNPDPNVAPSIANELTTTRFPSAAVSTQPFIKISTVKMLAQTLRGAAVVDEHTTCSILAKILSNARHMDIKIAVIESLVEIFGSTKDVELKEWIMDVLRARVVPIAASLDERYPMTEDDWEKAEADDVVPEIGGMSATDRPLLHLLFQTGLNSGFTVEWKKRWTEDVLLKVLKQSTENNQRWIALFEKAKGICCPDGETLPLVPVVARLYNDLLRDRPEFVTAGIFNDLTQHVMANISPPPRVTFVNLTIENNPALGVSNGAKHWRSLFGNGSLGALTDLGINTSAALLNWPASIWETYGTDGLTVPLIQKFLLEVADVFIEISDGRALNYLVDGLSSFPSSGFIRTEWCRKAQIAHALPILRKIVSRIDSLRTPEWQRDRHRHPRRLPDTFGIRLRMLPFPWTSSNNSHAGGQPAFVAKINIFAVEVISLIDELAHRSGRPYHEEWDKLKATVCRHPVRKSDFIRIAVVLGKGVAADTAHNPYRILTLSEYMRAELARKLIREGEDPSDRDVVRQTWELLVLRWKHSHDEVIRERARAVIRGLKESATAKSRWDVGNQFWARYHEEYKSVLARSVAEWG